MSLKLYDDALIEKIRGWTKNSSLQIVGTEQSKRLFEVIADENKDSPIQLPLISIKRRGGYDILNINKKPLTFDGLSLDSTVKKTIQLNAIPISIKYQIDIYTRYFEEADQYQRNIVFNIVNFPKLQIFIPYNDVQIQHDSNIRLLSEVQDNSEIPERLVQGQFTRLSLGVEVDDAYLWDARLRDNISIDVYVDAN